MKFKNDFMNELGNHITAEAAWDATRREVTVTLAGPHSLSENIITLREAQELHCQLGALLEQIKDT